MKYKIYLSAFVFCLCAIQVSAQESDSTQAVKPLEQVEDRYDNPNKYTDQVEKGKVFVCESKSHEIRIGFDRKRWWKGGHWAGVGIGYNGLISNLGHLSLPSNAEYMSLKSKSVTIMVNPVDFTIVSRANWAIITGLGFEFNNFNFDKNIGLTSLDGGIAPDYSYIINGVMTKKSKLVTAYLNVPLLMEFHFGGYKDGFINFGVIGGWRMQSHTKVKADMPGKDKVKQKNSQHLKNFHYGATVSGGYRNVGLYVTYYPQSIFRENQGPHVEQINLGVAILL